MVARRVAGAIPRKRVILRAVQGSLRILVVAPYPPRLAATHGGAKAIGEFLSRSAERHRVGLVYLSHGGEPPLDEALRSQLEVVEEVARKPEPQGFAHLARAARRRAHLLAGTPLGVSELASDEFEAAIRDVASRWQPDLVRLEPSLSASFAGAVTAPTVLVDHDPLLTTAADAQGLRRRAEAALERRAWRRFDRRTRADAAAVVVFTERDRRAVADAGGARLLVQIPLAVEPFPELDPVGRDDDSLLFIGNLNHPANRHAVRHARDEIVPRVRQRRPTATLTVVGQRPSAGEVDGDTAGVKLTGLVDDVVPYLDAAAVFIAPIRTGGGMRVKVLEALSSGKAVVAYPEALDGISAEHEREVFVAQSPQQFADFVVRLVVNRDERERIGRAARAWALANVSWEAVLDRYDDLYRELLSRPA
jgi:glycosyltransferase involved in cell wall biosynthesis